MNVFILFLTAFTVSVHSQLRPPPILLSTSPSTYTSYFVTKEKCCAPPRLPYEEIITVSKTAMPITVMPSPIIETIVPEISVPTVGILPFITELPNCPDVCFDDILIAPVGCLDPILNVYGTKEVCPLPQLPVCPLLASTPPVPVLVPPCSGLSPPVMDCDCSNHFLKRAPIPPPFI